MLLNKFRFSRGIPPVGTRAGYPRILRDGIHMMVMSASKKIMNDFIAQEAERYRAYLQQRLEEGISNTLVEVMNDPLMDRVKVNVLLKDAHE